MPLLSVNARFLSFTCSGEWVVSLLGLFELPNYVILRSGRAFFRLIALSVVQSAIYLPTLFSILLVLGAHVFSKEIVSSYSGLKVLSTRRRVSSCLCVCRCDFLALGWGRSNVVAQECMLALANVPFGNSLMTDSQGW